MSASFPSQTLAIIKPDAIAQHSEAAILKHILDNGFLIRAYKKTKLTKDQVEEFYAEHSRREYFQRLCQQMSSGELILLVLEKPNSSDVVQEWRILMGPTDPTMAAVNTIRGIFGTTLPNNAVHGSDSDESAQKEIRYFFGNIE